MPRVRKKAFPMGYVKPKVESMARTGAGQKQNIASDARKTKAIVKINTRRSIKKALHRDYKPPIHGRKKK